MPKATYKIMQANGKLVIETKIGTDYRFSIPKSVRHMIKPDNTVRITIEEL